MIWSHSISPQTVAQCLDSFDLGSESKQFAVSLTERNKSKLKFISYSSSSVVEDQIDTESSINEEEKTNNSPNDNFKVLKEKLIPLKSKILNLKFSNKGDNIYALDVNGDLYIWKFGLEGDDLNEPVFLLKNDSVNTSNILFNTFIKPEYLKLDSKSSKVESLLLTVESMSSSSYLKVKIFSIKSDEILEIYQNQIDFKLQNDLQFTFDISGQLVIFSPKNSMITTFGLPNVSIKKEVFIGSIFHNEPKESKTSIMSISTNRILLSKGSSLALLDLKFKSLLSFLDLYPRSKEAGSVKSPRTLTILQTPVVMGNSIKSKVSFALVILKNEKENYAQIQHVSIDTGLGKLSDSLGKAIPTNSENADFIPFTQFVMGDDEKIKSKMERKGDELNKAFENFKLLKSQNDLPKLEKSIVSFLKCYPKSTKIADGEFKVYEYESDRIVDPKFFKLVTKLLFDEDQEELKLSPDYIPELGLTYLLTHPLFPVEYTPGILKVLKSSPRLLRQAIVTCINLPCCDLIEELSSTDNDEIFKDIISRMTTDFSTDEITRETIKLLKRKSTGYNFDLDKIINKILKLNCGYEILNSFIDSNGLILSLHYSNDESQLDRLIKQTKMKTSDILEDSQLAMLVNVALQNKTTKKSKKSKKSKKKTDDITEDTSKTSMVLKISKNNNPLASDNNLDYRVDKLVI